MTDNLTPQMKCKKHTSHSSVVPIALIKTNHPACPECGVHQSKPYAEVAGCLQWCCNCGHHYSTKYKTGGMNDRCKGRAWSI